MHTLKEIEKKLSQGFNEVKQKSLDDFISITENFKELFSKEPKDYSHEKHSQSREIKRLIEEILPIRLFIDLWNGSQIISITLPDRNENTNYDAILKTKKKTYYIEVTCAKDGHQEHLQRRILDKYGYCFRNLSAEDCKESLNNNTPPESKFVLIKNSIRKYRNFISEAIEKKMEKNYPENTILVVSALCQSFVYGRDEDKADFRNFCSDLTGDISQKSKEKFKEIYLVCVLIDTTKLIRLFERVD